MCTHDIRTLWGAAPAHYSIITTFIYDVVAKGRAWLIRSTVSIIAVVSGEGLLAKDANGKIFLHPSDCSKIGSTIQWVL